MSLSRLFVVQTLTVRSERSNGAGERSGGKLRILGPDGSAVNMPTVVGASATVRLYAGWAFVFDGPPPSTVAVRR